MPPPVAGPASATPESSRKKRQPVPYGHACAGCSQAKCKCKRSALSVPCERCQRLGRECEPSRTPRKRGGGRPPNRTEQIEKRLDALVNILQPSNQEIITENTSGSIAPAFTPVSSSLPIQQRPSGVDHINEGINIGSAQVHDSSTNTSPTLLNELSPPESPDKIYSGLDPWQAQENLRTFRTSHLAAFPAIHIPPKLTSDQLRSRRPYVWLAIQSLCCTPLSARLLMQEKVRRILAEKVVVQHDSSIDLLLAVILNGAWGSLYARRDSFYVGANMAVTLTRNLKLDTSPASERIGFKAFAYASASGGIGEAHGARTEERMIEERRALLACFCLSSCTAHKLATPPMRWTPHMDESLRLLASHPECPNDEILVVQTRCARVLDDVCASSPYGFWGHETSRRLHGNIASTVLAKPIKEHFNEIRSQVRPEIQEKRLARFWLILTEIMILDLELQNPGPVASASLNFARARSLQSCLSAINDFFDNFLSMKPQEHSGLHFHYWLHYMRCARVVYRFLLADDPAWDSSTILESVDLMGALQRGAEICKAIPAATGLESNGKEAWTIFSANLLRLRTIWLEALVKAGVIPASEGVTGETASDPFASLDFDDLYSFDLWGDNLMPGVPI